MLKDTIQRQDFVDTVLPYWVLLTGISSNRQTGCIGWVLNGNSGGSYLSVDVELLHHEFNGKFNISSVFRNKILKGVGLFCGFMGFVH